MRKTCVPCAKKHLSQAAILLSESKRGYPAHINFAKGHMAEAEEELVKLYPVHANLVRESRLKLERNPNYTPNFEVLIEKIDRDCDVCELEHDSTPKRGRKLELR